MMAEQSPHAGSSFHLPVRQDWLDRTREAPIDPERPIIDPHHHLWDRPGWRYMLPDFLADTNDGHNIIGTVYVQARSMHRADGPAEFKPVGETEFAKASRP
jgi:L-fuconolactonase